MKTILSHANLIDCVEPKARPDTAVLIEDGRIRAILPNAEAGGAGDAQVIDLKGGYLMPGLWDVHIHPDYLSVDDLPLADQVTLFGHRLAPALPNPALSECAAPAHSSWMSPGSAPSTPDSISAPGLPAAISSTTTGGHFLTSGHALEVDGPYGRVKAIREQIKNGVDHIKLNLSGGIMGPAWDLVPNRSCWMKSSRRLRDLPEARLQGHGACDQPRGGKERDPAGRIASSTATSWTTSASRSCSSTTPGTCRPRDQPSYRRQATNASKRIGRQRDLRMRCAAAPRPPRTSTPCGFARRSMPVCEWRWAPTSAR